MSFFFLFLSLLFLSIPSTFWTKLVLRKLVPLNEMWFGMWVVVYQRVHCLLKVRSSGVPSFITDCLIRGSLDCQGFHHLLEVPSFMSGSIVYQRSPSFVRGPHCLSEVTIVCQRSSSFVSGPHRLSEVPIVYQRSPSFIRGSTVWKSFCSLHADGAHT